MSRLTRDGTAEPVSRDQIILRREQRGQGNINFPVQLTMCRNGNLTRLIHTHSFLLNVMTIHTYIVVVVVLSARELSAASLLALFLIS